MKIPKEAVPSCVGFSEIAAARLSLRRQLQQFQLLSEGMRGGWLIFRLVRTNLFRLRHMFSTAVAAIIRKASLLLGVGGRKDTRNKHLVTLNFVFPSDT